ncbi:Predicted O-linked N-acetylglucosamine transferase, SPINDLY family [Novosphingobium sp. CF614]|uniref:tetratricopeptide repeat protein n=1 Tax=Novosphingobium sp. CF614 TaxID=1884364 RepID=UPI0008EB1227|nr:tetratricopeptide repeat protein [Novosphingobium sp. CF614]SFF85951.1 Predicted O-linked N-acetylglucosamine transferase, SPINDLY family [Novosphingobium sp. CF614]
MSGLESLLIKAKGAAKRGETEAARAIYRQVLDKHPRNPRARAALEALEAASDSPSQQQFDVMVTAYRAGRMDEVARRGHALAEAFPRAHGVHNLLGAALLALEDNAGAETAFRRAIEADPQPRASYNNLAIALRKQGRLAEAEATYREVIMRAPDYADARYNLANLLQLSDRDDEAAEHFAAAIRIDPGYVDAHYNLGNLKAKAALREDALACFAQAVRLRPGHSDAHNNMGAELLALDRVDEALAAYDRALAANPANAQALINKGKALVLKGDEPGAIAAFRGALALDPGDRSARLQALFEEAHICDWRSRGEFVLTEGPEAAAVQPFASLPFIDDPAHQYRRSLACAAQMFPPAPASLPDPAPSTDGRIRIGYFSADFHNHATMYLMAGFFREHDRDRFDVRLYSYGPRREEDRARADLRGHADAFTEIGAMRDEDVVALARADGLDIAVDLKGYTRGTRTRLFGRRLAPVQVSFMGYPGTIGHPCMDYFIADPVTMPPGAERFFSEKIVRLAHCYQANDDKRQIVPDTRGRAGWDLPEQGFVFASFNHTYKISPREWDIWMGLLRDVPGSVLWLLRSNRWAEDNLRREAQARGIDPARLVFSPSVPHGEHLGRLAHADLFLDTFAVNAHTTASDALWAGLPVLTLAGRQFAARVAASLVHAVGLPELAVESEAAYAALALELARDPTRLSTIRNRLTADRTSQPLFDTTGYTRRVETALARMHERRLDGLAPDHFAVA